MDYGLHQSLARAVLARSDAIKQVRKSEQQDIDARLDKKKFLEKHESAFMVPKKFEYQPVRRDETELVQKPVVEELESRKKKLADRISSLRVESEEICKSLEAAEKSLNEMVSCADYDTTRYFVEEELTRTERGSDPGYVKQKAERQETEQFYLHKFREYILNSNRISRLQAKYENIRESRRSKRKWNLDGSNSAETNHQHQEEDRKNSDWWSTKAIRGQPGGVP